MRLLVGQARAIRRQIGNTGLGECKRRPLEKITAFKMCLFSRALIRESSFFRNKFDFELRQTKSNTHTFFYENYSSIFFYFCFKFKIIVLDLVVRTHSFEYIDIIILC